MLLVVAAPQGSWFSSALLQEFSSQHWAETQRCISSLQPRWFAARFCLSSQWHCHCLTSPGDFPGKDTTCAFGFEFPCAVGCFWCCGWGRKWSRICPARLLLCLCCVQKPVQCSWSKAAQAGCPSHQRDAQPMPCASSPGSLCATAGLWEMPWAITVLPGRPPPAWKKLCMCREKTEICFPRVFPTGFLFFLWMGSSVTGVPSPAPSPCVVLPLLGKGGLEKEERQHSTQTAHPYHGEVWFPYGGVCADAFLGPQCWVQVLQTSLLLLIIPCSFPRPWSRVHVLHRGLSQWLVEGVMLFVGWRDTLGTAHLAGFAISVGLIVGNSWCSQERSAIARCQKSKTKQSSPDTPLPSSRSNQKWLRASHPGERQTRASALILKWHLAPQERTFSKDLVPWLFCAQPWCSSTTRIFYSITNNAQFFYQRQSRL